MSVTRYAKSGDVHIAYQVFGEGPVDIVLVPGFVSHVENNWDEPGYARWLKRLSSFARVVMFDKRGTGLSDSVSELPCLDNRMEDVQATRSVSKRPRSLEYRRAGRCLPCSRAPIPRGEERIYYTVLSRGLARGFPTKSLLKP